MAWPKKTPNTGVPMPPLPSLKPKKGEAVPGMLATRQALKGHRLDSLRHIPKKGGK